MRSELLNPEEFDTHLRNGSLRLALIGMSNAGKSYRAKVLHAENGFEWCNIDDEIRKALELGSVDDLAGWLGYPTSENYYDRQDEYLELESKFTKAAANLVSGKNLVFDTTGSVIHLSEDCLDALRANSLIVHLDVGDEALTTLLDQFFTHTKPIIWENYFSRDRNQTETEALRASYPRLLSERLKKYRELAHVAVPATTLRDTSADETLRIIRAKLR